MSFFDATLNTAADAVYQYFEPLRSLFRLSRRNYRLTCTYNNGMTTCTEVTPFIADHDQQARRKAKTLSCGHPYTLEEVRAIKLR